jgi:hypothetical protein
MINFTPGDAVDFLYTTEDKPGSPSRTIHVVGTVVEPSNNSKGNTSIVCVKLADPSVNKGRPYITCKLARINAAVPAAV